MKNASGGKKQTKKKRPGTDSQILEGISGTKRGRHLKEARSTKKTGKTEKGKEPGSKAQHEEERQNKAWDLEGKKDKTLEVAPGPKEQPQKKYLKKKKNIKEMGFESLRERHEVNITKQKNTFPTRKKESTPSGHFARMNVAPRNMH